MKRRFIQMREPPYDLVEVPLDYDPEPRRYDGLLYNDRQYSGMQATDGTDISTRSRHREYMRRNGLTTMDDFKGTWAKAREKRDAYFTGVQGTGAVRREDIAKAIAQLERKK